MEQSISQQVFSANFDSNSTVKQYLDPPIFARYIRLHPKQWSGSCALRAEFHGCYEGMYSCQLYKYWNDNSR
jgi:coagulation factor VIII